MKFPLLHSALFLFGIFSSFATIAQDELPIFYEYQKLSSSEPPFEQLLEKGDEFGKGMAAIGDLNGDGVTELAVGSPGNGMGAIWILFMDKEGNVLQTQKISASEGGFNGKLTPNGGFGSRIETMGDVDEDGTVEILVGEPQAKLGVLAYGVLWKLKLNSDGTVKESQMYSGRTPGLQGVLARDQQFGTDVAFLEDIDGNGVNDWAVGTTVAPEKGTGRVYLLFMKADGSVEKTLPLELNTDPKEPLLKKGDQFGMAVESLGDLDEDGVGDLVVGARLDDDSGVNQGAVWILFLDENGGIKSHQKIVSKSNGFGGYLDHEDRMGISLANLGDMNGDEIPDLAVGSHADDDGGKDKGAVYVMYLNRDGTVKDSHKISETSRNFEGSFSLKYNWGWSVSPLGDLNEDGRNDLLVNGHFDNGGGATTGALWMLFPADWPERLLKKGTFVEGSWKLSTADSAKIYASAENAADSARIDSLYDLSGYAPNNLTLLLDVSASMNKPQRLPILRDAFIDLLAYMRPSDKITVITYSGKPTIQLNGVPATEQEKIANSIQALKSSGETRPEKALKLAYEQALFHYIANGNNRIIFATDGGFDSDVLNKPMQKYATERIPMSVFYFGKLAPYKIGEMREIATKGFGNSAHINSSSVNQALLTEIKMIRLKTDEE